MVRRALITGAAGQDGHYLAELLAEKGYELFCMLGPDAQDCHEELEALGYTCVEGDLADADSLLPTMQAVGPDEVYNLAGLSSVAASWDRPELYMDINGRGVERLLAAIKQHAPHARFVQASSADMFGEPKNYPQSEETPIAPSTPYGESKAYAHRAVGRARSEGIHASAAILFNHESPMRPPSFVTAKIADGAARIAAGVQDELRLGNLDAVRDWGFAGDFVECMHRMASAEEPGDYVIATGEGHTVRDFCAAAFGHLGLEWQEYVVVDEAFFRPVDAVALVGDASRARDRLGWRPQVGFDELVGMMVDARVAALSHE